MPNSNYTTQITELEDGTLSVRISESYYRSVDAKPITEHHRFNVEPTRSVDSDYVLNGIKMVRPDWVDSIVSCGHCDKTSQLIASWKLIAHTPEVVQAYETTLSSR